MTLKPLCPYYNVGYCKYKDKCSKDHAKEDCKDLICDTKKCNRRHRRHCKFGPKCSFYKKNACEFLHISNHNSNIQKKLEDMQMETKKCFSEAEHLKEEIKSLKETIAKQKTQLSASDKDKQSISKSSNNQVDTLKVKVAALEEEKIKFVSFISEGKEHMKEKDKLIKSLKQQLSAIKKRDTDVSVDSSIRSLFKCDKCEFNATNEERLKLHKNSEHTVVYPCHKCQHKSETQNGLENHLKQHVITYDCRMCTMRFKRKSFFNTHMQTKHPDTVAAHDS